jgi:hypothetical protein
MTPQYIIIAETQVNEKNLELEGITGRWQNHPCFTFCDIIVG